nr:hypothetical protein [Tanacetum cinerariifolium]
MPFEEVKEKFKTVWEQIEGGVFKISKGEATWLKRKGIRSEQESAKKQKTTEEVPEEVKSCDEIPEEKIKELIRLVPIEEVYVEALQVKHLIINWKVELKRLYEPDVEDHLWTHTQHIMHAPIEWRLYDTCRVHHVMFKDLEIFMLVEKNYPLKKALALVMICYKLWSIKFRGGLLGIKCTRHSHCQLQSSHCQKNFPLPEKKDATARRKEKPLPERSHCYQ